MAVLVGVLAPTLIRNVEKSRKSKDDQNLDAIKEAIQVTLQDEKAYAAAVPSTGSTTIITIDDAGYKVDITDSDFTDEFEDNLQLPATTKLSSKDYKGKKVVFSVNTKGTVEQAAPTDK